MTEAAPLEGKAVLLPGAPIVRCQGGETLNKNDVDQLEMISAIPRAMFIWVKQIDGDPRNGCSIVMAQRVMHFCDLRRRQNFYEPLSSHDSVMASLIQTARVQNAAWLDEEKRDRTGISFHIWEGAYTATDGHLAPPTAREKYLGVHAVDVVSWADGGETLIFRNSWGSGWGRRGYGSVSREYLERYLHDAWLRKNARYGFTQHDFPSLAAAQSDRDWARIWLRENSRRRTRIPPSKGRVQIWSYDTWSIEDDVPVTVVEVRSGDSRRFAWAMLFHEPGRVCVVKEFFVWPTVRRQGYGRLLEGVVVMVARSWREEVIQIYFHSADCLPGKRGPGRLFGMAMGYEWRWRQRTLPNLDAVGEKAL